MARPSLANTLTMSRFVLAPLFALVFGLMARFEGFALPGTIALFVIFGLVELSDVLDGAVARRQNTVSDVGKILDPFADVVSKVTYFVCLLVAGIVPLWFLLIVLYREFGVILVRMILYRQGLALGARAAGKLKTWFYAVTAAAGLVFLSMDTLQGLPVFAVDRIAPTWRSVVMFSLLGVTAALSIGSFLQYFVFFLKNHQSGENAGDRP